MNGPQCTAATDRLNCGCCGDVRLDCDLVAGHDGLHQCTDTHRRYDRTAGTHTDVTYRIFWGEA